MKKELIISKLKDFAKGHFYIFILLLLTLVFFYSILSSSKILDNIHYTNDMTFQSENIRKSMFESAGFPLWTPFFYAGQPFMAIPEHYLFDLNFIYILLFRNIFFAMNLSLISYFFLAGLGMYLLVYELTNKKNPAFIAAIVFTFNGLMHAFILRGHLNILESYSLTPFVFFFTYKALKHRHWVKYSIFAALFFSMMIYAGGIIFFLYTGLIVGIYMLWNLTGKNFSKRLIKTTFVSLVIVFLLVALSAMKLLPVLEFTKLSNRNAGVSFQEYLGEPISLSSLWNSLINLPETGFSGSIGIFAGILLLLGLLSLRKKIVAFSFLLIILSILLASGSFVANLFYNLPGFGQMRHVERALVMFVFAAPLIIAFGYNNLIVFLRKHNITVRESVIFSVIIVVLVTELMLFQKFPGSREVIKPTEIPILSEINKDKSVFRIANYALSTPIGASGYNYYAQLDIPSIKGGGGIWINDYVQYLAIAQQTAPSKLFGILNGKYIISDRETDDPGLKLKKVFEKCSGCPIWEAYGPYLYENENTVPRAFVVDNSILVLGNENSRRDFSYGFMINNLDPLSAVLIHDKNSVDSYKTDELGKFNAIILLSGSVTQNGIPALRQFKDSGGKVLPDILENKDTISQQEIAGISAINSSYKELKINQISVNKYLINLDGERGWLVLSERFAHFPGWKSTINKKTLKLYKADNVISAIYLEGDRGKLTFEYNPNSFRTGRIITFTAILVLVAYLIYFIFGKKMKSL